MTIDRLNSMDPIQNPKKPAGPTRDKAAKGGDSIAFSAEAQEKAELFRGIELAKAAPDVRAEKIAALKAKIDDPAYIDDAVLSITADRILEQLL